MDPPPSARDSPISGTASSCRARTECWPWGPEAWQGIPPLSVSSPAGTDAGGPALVTEAEEIKQNISRLNQEVWWGPEVGACSRKPRERRPVLTAVCPFPDQPPQPGGFAPQPGDAEHDGAAQESLAHPTAPGLSLPSARDRLAASPAVTTRCPGALIIPGAPQLPQLPLRQPPVQTLPRPQPLCPRRCPAPLGGRRGAAAAAGGNPRPRPRPSPGLGLAAAPAAVPLRPFFPRLLGRGLVSRPPAAAHRLHQLPLTPRAPAGPHRGAPLRVTLPGGRCPRSPPGTLAGILIRFYTLRSRGFFYSPAGPGSPAQGVPPARGTWRGSAAPRGRDLAGGAGGDA